MNNGFFNFPNVSDSNLLDIKEFDSSGSYSIPQGTELIQIIAIAAGSGGGSGRVRSTGNAFGGGGGAGGSTLIYTFLREQIPTSTLLVLIGAGGLGGAARSTGSAQNGAAGTAGGQTRIYVREGGVAIPGTSLSATQLNGLLLSVSSGTAGIGGTNLSGPGGTGRPIFSNGSFSAANQAGGTSVFSSGVAGNTTVTHIFSRGGGSGAPNSSGAVSGGNITISSTPSFLNPDLPSGTFLQGSAADSTADAPSSVGYVLMPYMGGMGGAGGGSSVNGNLSLGGGGNGWRGGGGGGGGANVVLVSGSVGTAGKGGNGGNGYAAIFCYK